MASDGIWDVIRNSDIAKLVISLACTVKCKNLIVDSTKLGSAARLLNQVAKARGSNDNLSSVIVDLQN
jgi:serine/threonine protein phosphatase PrpC